MRHRSVRRPLSRFVPLPILPIHGQVSMLTPHAGGLYVIGIGISPVYTQSSLRALDSIIYHHRIIPTRDTQMCRRIYFLFEVRHDMMQQ